MEREIKVGRGEDEIDAFLIENESKKGLIVIHEIFGLNEHIKNVARRFAKEGYVVLAPSLFSSKDMKDIASEENIGLAMKIMFSIPPEKQRDIDYLVKEFEKHERRNELRRLVDLLFLNRPIERFTKELVESARFLKEQCNVERVGSVGFCFGGGMSLNLACTGEVDSAVTFYGENPKPIDKIKGFKGSFLGIYAGEDSRINAGIPELVREMVDKKLPFHIKVYKGVHHAFFNDTGRNYNKEAAEDAYLLTKLHFSRTL
ncbi:MAG: dienelactone hydrolase family protein [Candidatus Micrarchaeaceae archaeon]